MKRVAEKTSDPFGIFGGGLQVGGGNDLVMIRRDTPMAFLLGTEHSSQIFLKVLQEDRLQGHHWHNVLQEFTENFSFFLLTYLLILQKEQDMSHSHNQDPKDNDCLLGFGKSRLVNHLMRTYRWENYLGAIVRS